jgi:hypothetical protein
MKGLLALVLVLAASAALAQTPSPPAQGHTAAGASFTIPPGWTQHTSPSVIILDAPENDAHLAIVDVAQAADGKAAAASAWRLYRGGESHPFKLLTSLPARNGWEEQAAVNYETSANEHLALAARASRKGTTWTVAIVDGSEGTF